MAISIETVSNKRQLADFLNVRNEIFRGDPYFVRPLRSMELTLIDPDKHPFYQHAKRELFVAYRDGKTVGRVAAIIDDLHNEHYQEQMGFFGFFECYDDDEVAQQLLDTASRWLKERRCTHIRGPVNPSMKGEFGIVVDGHHQLPFLMMPHSRPYYQRLVEAYGFEKKMDFFAYHYNVDLYEEEAFKIEASLEENIRRITERYPDVEFRDCPKDRLRETIREINQLGNQVRSEGFGFVPLTEAELDFMVEQLKRIVRTDTIVCAYVGNRLVGYCVNLPDLNWALQKCFGKWDWVRMPQLLYWLRKTPRTRVIAIGSDREYRNKGVGALLAFEMRYRGLRMPHFRLWEFSWVAENNVRSFRNIRRTIPIEEARVFRLYEKPL